MSKQSHQQRLASRLRVEAGGDPSPYQTLSDALKAANCQLGPTIALAIYMAGDFANVEEINEDMEALMADEGLSMEDLVHGIVQSCKDISFNPG